MPTVPDKHIYETLEEADEVLRGIMSGEVEFHRPKLLTIAGQRVTEKMVRFVREYVIDFSLVAAAGRSGYSQKSKAKIGTELITKPVIKALIEIAKESSRKKTEADEDRVINEYRRIAFSNLQNYYHMTHMGPVLKRFDEMTEDQTAAIKELYTDKHGNYHVKLWEKPKSLDSLATHLKLLEKIVQHKNDPEHPFSINLGIKREMSENEIFALLEEKTRRPEKQK